MSKYRFASSPAKVPGLSPLASLTNGLSGLCSVTQQDVDRCRALKEGVPGWSEMAHYVVFRELLKAKPNASWLICGVYHGRDLRYIEGIAKDLGQTPRLVGVDLFSDQPAADWPEHCKGKSWQEAMNCPAPDMEAAKINAPTAEIHQGDSVTWMRSAPCLFDIIWHDSAHDELTLWEEINAARRILAPGGLLGGDDYVWDAPTAGVDKAVQALLPGHVVLFDRIWLWQAP